MTATSIATTRATSPSRTGRAFVAEWTKLRTLRSTWATVVGSAVFSVFLGAIVTATQAGQWDEMSPSQRADFDATSLSLVGVLFATVIVGSLGVRSMTSEYTTGMIRSTFAAMPCRRRVVVAKAAIIGALALPAALVANIIAFGIGQQILSSTGAQVSLGDGTSTRAMVYGAVAVGITAVLGVGLGTIVKRTAIATTALSVAIVGSQLFGVALPEAARKFLPGSALQAAVTGNRADDLLQPLAGLVTLTVYAIVAMVIAVLVITRRDA